MVDFYNKQDYYGGMQGLYKNVSETQIPWPLDTGYWILGIFEILKLYWNHWDTKILLDNTYFGFLYWNSIWNIMILDPENFRKWRVLRSLSLTPIGGLLRPQILRTLDIPLNIFSNYNLLYFSILLLVQKYPILSSQNAIIFRFKLRQLYQNSSLIVRPFMTFV